MIRAMIRNRLIAQYLAEVGADSGVTDSGDTDGAVDADEQYRAELETGAGAEPDGAEPDGEEGTESMPELESMDEG